jgi:hypothetical protein
MIELRSLGSIMNEFEHTFKDFKSGLRPTKSLPVGAEALTECFNTKAGEFNLEPFEPLAEAPIDPPPGYASFSWPFPQIIGCRDRAFAIYRDTVNQWDDIYLISQDWDLIWIARIDALNFGSMPTRRYEVIDFGTFVALTNGVAYVYFDVDTNSWRAGNYNYGSTILGVPVPRTWCAFRGQIVAGGFYSIPSGSWWSGFGSNTVGWSNIGEASFLYDLRNIAGHRPMPWAGEVRHVLPLRTGVVIYSTGGIGILRPVREPAVTYQFEEVSSCGVLDTDGCPVAGDLDSHLYIDRNNQLNRIASNFQTSLLQYDEFISELNAPVISLEPDGTEFYISDAETCYILTKYGLSSCYQRVSSIARINGTNVAVFSDSTERDFRVSLHPIDFGMRGQKTLFTLEAGLEGGLTYADVEWRIDKKKDFRSSGWKLLNQQGISTHKIAGTEFQIKLRGSHYEDMKLSYIKARWKMTDMRSIRGVYAPR